MILLQALFLRAIQTNIASMVRVLQKKWLGQRQAQNTPEDLRVQPISQRRISGIYSATNHFSNQKRIFKDSHYSL